MGSMGALCMIYEMMGQTSVPVEVVIGANIIPAKEQDFAETVCSSPEPPVVPFALIAEWLGHGALHENPGLLLHGLELRGIREIIGYSPRSVAARISSTPTPATWMTDPLRSKWIADPLVLDCACQMAIIWFFEERKNLSLPSYSASYRQYRDSFPTDGVTAILEVKEVTDHKMTGDFTFLDSEDVVVARLAGYEAVMDASLSKAFKSKHAA